MANKGNPGRLTDRQQRFVEEYLVDLQAAAAAVRAGYSPKTAASLGHRLKKLPQVRAAIRRAQAARRRRTHISQDRVVEELARIAFADIRDFAGWSAEGIRLRDSAELTPDQAVCVAEIVESAGKSGKSVRVKLHSKTQALIALARHLGGEKKPDESAAPRTFTILTSVPQPAAPPEAARPVRGGD